MPLGFILVLAVSASPKPFAQQVLEEQCLMNAADPTNPWALAHGITGLGKKFAAADGRLAGQVMVNDFLLKISVPDGGAPLGSPYGFLKYAPDGTPIEPHTNLISKTLVLSGFPMSTTFATRSAGKVTLQQLVDSAKAGFRHVPQNEDYWKDVAWTLDLFGAGLKPGNAKFKVSDGTVIDFDQVMDDALAYHEQATAGLKAGLDKGLPSVPKNKQGIYAHSCGGLHLTQALIAWARHPEVRKKWGKRFEDLVAVLFYRLDSERAQYEQALQQAPQYRLQVLTQMVKFYGHFLETTARLKTEAGWKPTEAQAMSVRKAKALLDAAARWLEEDKAFTRMDQLKQTNHQVWLDLIGDSCHAAHGLQGWP
jgi:hypothetical protein